MRGSFIVFEGIDGAGKTTQIHLLKEYLEGLGRKVFETCEPTENSITGKALRDALSGNEKKTITEMATLFLQDRIFHNIDATQGIKKMLDAGYVVICDRYYYSSMAYQGSEIPGTWVKDMNMNCPDICHPDLCVFLDLTPKQSLQRISSRGLQREIYENEEKLTKTRNRFLQVFDELKEEEHIEIINAYDTIENVFEKVKDVTKTFLNL